MNRNAQGMVAEKNRTYQFSKAIEDEVQQLCDEAFERGLKAGREETTTPGDPEEEKFDVRCEIEFDVQCDREDFPEALATKACYLSALRAAVGFGREQGLGYLDIEGDLVDVYDAIVNLEGE